MTKDFCRDTTHNFIGITKSFESGLNSHRILMKTAEGLFFAVKKAGAARTQGVDQCIVISATRLVNNIGTTCCGKKPNEVKLLRRESLLADNEETAGDECTCLLGHTTDEGTDLVTLFMWDDIQHCLPCGVSDA